MKDISSIIQEKAQKNPFTEGRGFRLWSFDNNAIKGMYYEFPEERLWVLYNRKAIDDADSQKTLFYLRSKTEQRDFTAHFKEKEVRQYLSNCD